MKVDREEIADQRIYEILYFTPVEVGVERYTTLLYFQTDIYARVWPTSFVERMTSHMEELRHVELGIRPFDSSFKQRHREAVLQHNKMALAYLDSREVRIAMKLCEHCEPATKSSEQPISTDPEADFDFLRVTTLTVLACAARRVKFFQKAIDALTEAKNICLHEGQQNQIHPLLTALTLLNLSAVLGDIDHDEQGLRWGLEVVAMLKTMSDLPEVVKAYFMAMACHNAALLAVKLARWGPAVELFDLGLEHTKAIEEQDDGLREKLISVGARAKQVPEGFLREAVNALNGWGEEKGVWNLSFWDFSISEIEEEIAVLKQMRALADEPPADFRPLTHLIIDHFDDERPHEADAEDEMIARFTLAVVDCPTLERVTVAGLDIDPRKVWLRVRKRGFLETTWYATVMNFSNLVEEQSSPPAGSYSELLKNLNPFSKKLVMFLVVLGNESKIMDLSDNAIDSRSISALVTALRWRDLPSRVIPVECISLRKNALDPEAARLLARAWEEMNSEEERLPSLAKEIWASPKKTPTVTSLDVSENPRIGDEGLQNLVAGLRHYDGFQELHASAISLTAAGCIHLDGLKDCSRFKLLDLSKNSLGQQGSDTVCRTAQLCENLETLLLDECDLDADAAPVMAEMLREHSTLTTLSLRNNRFGSEGVITLCQGAEDSSSLEAIYLANNGIETKEAAQAIAEMMRQCDTLGEIDLSGCHFERGSMEHIGCALESSRMSTMLLSDMNITDEVMDDFLDRGAAETQELKLVDLSKNPVGDSGLTLIAECLSIGLTDLNLSDCGLTEASQGTMLNLVSLSPHLQRLDLSHNKLGAQGVGGMVEWLMENQRDSFSIRSLELSGCFLKDDGFVQLVPVMSLLEHLALRDNGITAAGMIAVMQKNKMIQLKTLDLENNHIGEDGVHALTERFQQEHKRSLWNPKQLTSTIEKVILRNNGIALSVAASTEAFIKVNNPLLNVVW